MRLREEKRIAPYLGCLVDGIETTVAVDRIASIQSRGDGKADATTAAATATTIAITITITGREVRRLTAVLIRTLL